MEDKIMEEKGLNIIDKLKRLNETLKYEKIFREEYGLDKIINVGFLELSENMFVFYPFLEEEKELVEIFKKSGRKNPVDTILNFYNENTMDGIINRGSLEENIISLKYVNN